MLIHPLKMRMSVQRVSKVDLFIELHFIMDLIFLLIIIYGFGPQYSCLLSFWVTNKLLIHTFFNVPKFCRIYFRESQDSDEMLSSFSPWMYL